MRRSDEPAEPQVNAVVVVLATGLAYYALAQAMWHVNPTWGSAFWPAAGITLAVLCRSPKGRWPAILAIVACAELAADQSNGSSLRLSLLGAAANVAEPALGAALLRRRVPRGRLTDITSLGWFVCAAVVAGPLLGGLIGGGLSFDDSGPAIERWVRWAVGDGVGVLAVAPLLLTVWRPGAGFVRRCGGELALSGLALCLLAVLMAEGGSAGTAAAYLAVPAGLWLSLRFGVSGAAVFSTVIAATAHTLTATGHGPFVTGGDADLVLAQLFVGVVALSNLAAAVLSEDLLGRAAAEKALMQRALHDPLTGAANRALLDDRLGHHEAGAVVVVDLDGFKAINDVHGHLVGDAVLQEVAARLREVCRPDDLVARFGGDEFVVVVSSEVDDIDALTGRIERCFARPIDVGGVILQVGASVGGVLAEPSVTGAELLAAADRAMYRRKDSRTIRLDGREEVPRPQG